MQDVPEIQAVIFDLGRVIVDVDVSKLASFVAATPSQTDIDRVIMNVLNDELMLKFNTGQVGPEEFYRGITGRFDLQLEFEEFATLWCGVFSPIAGMPELIRQLEGRFKLGLLSDTDPLHWNHLRRTHPILEVFRRPTLSFQVGMTKPDPAIFQTAARHVDTPPQACLYIDDLPANAAGAAAVGMKSIVFRDPCTLRRQLAEMGLIAASDNA
ncbi:MAG TPA: HAD family phosphatase [Anaerohalosphaeraceae bacterium]|jgi:FMN phosphatase YigB (HAD superfamily)|nr:HAD family phosphatase [Anaerohalosphaeraceae bacterium]HRT51029.1 HAD family phosphatase [Anaerohalosphaeraceae bacterium]HRT87015.1 HAD family phosphatase [Anaerohalosphaeraceae bacterium]